MREGPTEPAVTGMAAVLQNVASLLTWCLEQMTEITSWLVANDLGGIYVGMFIIGFAVALMYRILKSA